MYSGEDIFISHTNQARYYTYFTICCEEVEYRADWSEQSIRVNCRKDGRKLDLDFSSPIISTAYLTRL